MRSLIVALGAASLALGVAAPAFAQDTAIEARLAQYRERVARLEDQDAIEDLQADYGYYFDKGLWDDVADLFTRDGSFEYGQRGVYIGKERIRHALLLFGARRARAAASQQPHAIAGGDPGRAGRQDRDRALAGHGDAGRARP